MLSETADFAPGTATWRTGRKRVVFDTGLFPPLHYMKTYGIIHKTGST